MPNGILFDDIELFLSYKFFNINFWLPMYNEQFLE